jgi:hypothetical protein
MKVLNKVGAWIMVAGLILVIAGGMKVRGGPDGTWFQLNMMHFVGGGLLLFGVALTVISAFAKRNK